VRVRADNGTSKRLQGKSVRVELGDDKAPKWNLLLPKGEFHRDDFPTKDGRIVVDDAYVEAMVANWEKAGKPWLPVDYHHWGSSSDTRVRKEDKEASGWVHEIRAGAAGLEGLTEWVDEAREKILAKKLLYFSPEWFHDGPDKHTGKSQGPTFCGGALLNDPFFLGDLPRMAAAEPPSPPSKESTTVNKKLLCKRLGIAEDSTDEQINAALEKAEETVTADAGSLEKLTGTVDTLKAELTKANAAAAESTKKLAALEKATADKALAELQSSLVKAGKLKPDAKERVAKLVAAIGVEETEKLTADWPVVVEHGERGIPGEGTADSIENAVAKFDALVTEEMAKTKCSSRDAIRRVSAAHRELATKAFTITKPAEA
jgi:phage I-like protein